jgi:ketosteroid isomerase-like protein
MATLNPGILGAIAHGTAARDAVALLERYADDAVVTVIDRSTPPSRPRVLHGREEIGGHLRDTFTRETAHDVRDLTDGGDRIAYTTHCRYPDGTRVACAALAELDADGRIARQTVIQAWDE